MTKTNTEAVEAAVREVAEAMHALNPAHCDPKEASDHYDRASRAFSSLRHCLAALSPTAKTEPSAAGLDNRWIGYLASDVAEFLEPDHLTKPESSIRIAGHISRNWCTIRTALSAPTRERELLSEAREWIKVTHPADVSADALARRIDNLLNEGNADG